MTEFVLDASALVLATTVEDEPGRELRSRLVTSDLHAPHHMDAEFGNVLRRHTLSGRLGDEAAKTALTSAKFLIDQRYPHTGPLAEAAWALRGAITFYDALYVALAKSLDLPLLTADARLARAPELPCAVELVA